MNEQTGYSLTGRQRRQRWDEEVVMDEQTDEGKDEMRQWSWTSRLGTHWLEGREGKDEMRKWSWMSRQGTHILEGREDKDEMRKWS
ncbi:hypothetical protein M422DRAFT_274113 [Sphaerobolus stellatus SS14]|uniref:Uncharacterized protein n=1 Tax=Sphaerobolus stellatus (strain SS14) TaxID=990650 RepID=A0A0C9UHZ6_SPHS4|nr:hypothetical protein M422DRAFT_274113 [Sphaerobolus stellatus SS14]